jgi:hypothetical protein
MMLYSGQWLLGPVGQVLLDISCTPAVYSSTIHSLILMLIQYIVFGLLFGIRLIELPN